MIPQILLLLSIKSQENEIINSLKLISHSLIAHIRFIIKKPDSYPLVSLLNDTISFSNEFIFLKSLIVRLQSTKIL